MTIVSSSYQFLIWKIAELDWNREKLLMRTSQYICAFFRKSGPDLTGELDATFLAVAIDGLSMDPLSRKLICNSDDGNIRRGKGNAETLARINVGKGNALTVGDPCKVEIESKSRVKRNETWQHLGGEEGAGAERNFWRKFSGEQKRKIRSVEDKERAARGTEGTDEPKRKIIERCGEKWGWPGWKEKDEKKGGKLREEIKSEQTEETETESCEGSAKSRLPGKRVRKSAPGKKPKRK